MGAMVAKVAPSVGWPLGEEILRARVAAHAKHGGNSIEAEPAGSPRWLAILVEEVGEVARALTYDGTGDLRSELIDVAAVITAWIDALDDRSPLGPRR